MLRVRTYWKDDDGEWIDDDEWTLEEFIDRQLTDTIAIGQIEAVTGDLENVSKSYQKLIKHLLDKKILTEDELLYILDVYQYDDFKVEILETGED